MENIAPFVASYIFATLFILLAACIAYAQGELKGSPLAFVFWPIIAASAAAIYIRDMWRK